MTIGGTVINGVIVLDGSPQLPEGKRVVVDLEGDDFGPSTETYAEHLELLRKSLAMMDAGEQGMPLEEFAAELKAEFGLAQVAVAGK